MNPINLLSTAFALGLATTVTAGSMYITAKAAVQQEQDKLGRAFVASGEVEPNEVLSLPGVVDSAPALSPGAIVHDSSNEIVLDAAGGFSGRLNLNSESTASAARDYTVKILQGGVEVAVTKSDADGKFSVTGLKPGVIGIVASSEDGLLISGGNLVQAELGKTQPVAVELAVDAAVVAKSDVSLARQLIAKSLGVGDLSASDESVSHEEELPLGSTADSSDRGGLQLQLEEDGSLKGKINLLDEQTGQSRGVSDLKINFLRDGRIVQFANVEPDGRFTVRGLIPGAHSLIGTGKDGVFALGVEIVGSSYEPEKGLGDATPASLQAAPGSGMGISPVGPTNLNGQNVGSATGGTIPSNPSGQPGQPTPPANPVASTPTAPGGGAPGTGGGGGTPGGGGGGIGGGGGFGGILGAAAGGALGFALGRDRRNSASPNN